MNCKQCLKANTQKSHLHLSKHVSFLGKSIKLYYQTLPNLHQIISLIIPIKGSFIVLLLWSRLLSSNRFYGSFFTIKHYVRSSTQYKPKPYMTYGVSLYDCLEFGS